MRPRLRAFNHAHRSYNTLFGLLHVKIATCGVGFCYLLAVCSALVVCVLASQAHRGRGALVRPVGSSGGSSGNSVDVLTTDFFVVGAGVGGTGGAGTGGGVSLKLLALPMATVVVAILYLFIGILQQKARLLAPFIALQIVCCFVLIILLMILIICTLCDARVIVNLFIGRPSKDDRDYSWPVGIVAVSLAVLFAVHVWTTRVCCCCFRYFTDLAKHAAREASFV